MLQNSLVNVNVPTRQRCCRQHNPGLLTARIVQSDSCSYSTVWPLLNEEHNEVPGIKFIWKEFYQVFIPNFTQESSIKNMISRVVSRLVRFRDTKKRLKITDYWTEIMQRNLKKMILVSPVFTWRKMQRFQVNESWGSIMERSRLPLYHGWFIYFLGVTTGQPFNEPAP